MQAVVTAPAVVRPIVLAEIIEQQFPAALAGLRVSDHLRKQLAAYLLLGHRLALHEFLQFLYILITVVCYAVALLPVTTRPARLLIVALYALRNVVMYHETHIRLVDAHPERYSGHDHVHVFHKETVLVLGPRLGIKPGMIRQGLDPVDVEQLRKFLDLLAAEAIYYSGLSRILPDVLDDVLLRLDLVPHLIVEVGTVERGLEHRGVRNPEIFEYVALHLRSGGSGEGDYRRPADLIHQSTNTSVLRAEIMAPLGYAVRLVHGIERNLHLTQQRHILFLGERLGSHIEKFCPPREQVFPNHIHLLAGEGRIKEMRNAARPGLKPTQQIDLVLHQRDQRRYHNGRPVHKDGRELIAERFSATGRHEHKGVSATNQMADDRFLVALESVVAEELLESLVNLRRVRSHNRQSNVCMASPDLSLGSNQVVLGGIILPLSAMLISCFMDTG